MRNFKYRREMVLPLRYYLTSQNSLCNINNIIIGKAYDPLRGSVSINYRDFLRHAIIVGTTGSGKTTTASIIAKQLRRFGKVIILDWNGEYHSLIPHYRQVLRPGFNLRIPLPIHDVIDFVSIIEEVFDLSPSQSYILQRILERSEIRGVTVSELIEYIEGSVPESRWMIESKLALLRKINLLSSPELRNSFSGNAREFLSLFDDNVIKIIDLATLRYQKLRKFCSLVVIKILEDYLRKARVSGDIYVIIEEAHNIVKENGLIERVLAEVRKFGMGLILITQSPSFIGWKSLVNSNVRIIHALKSKYDIESMSRSCGLTDMLSNKIPYLGVGEAVVDAPSLDGPILTKILMNE
jgi:hypothetical protein